MEEDGTVITTAARVHSASSEGHSRHITIGELSEALFSVRCVLSLYNKNQLLLPVSPSIESFTESLHAGSQLRKEKQAAETRESSGTQRKGKVCCWKPLLSCAMNILSTIAMCIV